MNVWLPIETIPSGEKVLVWDGHAMYVAEAPLPRADCVFEVQRGRFITDWSAVDPDSYFNQETGAPFTGYPTHWTRLPSPPVLA